MGIFKKFAILCVSAAITCGFVSCGDDDDDDIGVVPTAFVEALASKYPNVKNVKWEIKRQYKVAEFNEGMKEIEVWFDQSAAWKMTETDFGKDFFLVPDNVVTSAFEKTEYSYWTVDDIKKYERTDKTFYIFEVEKTGERDVDIYISLGGEVIKTTNDTDIDITPTTPI